MREECGLAVEVGELLYVTDRFKALGRQTVDMAFEVRLSPGERRELRPGPIGPFPAGADPTERIAEARMVPVGELAASGFSSRFAALVAKGFPGRGAYMGDFHEFYGDPRSLRRAV